MISSAPRHGLNRPDMNKKTIPLGNIDRHFWLTRSVARMIGISLSDAMTQKRLGPDDYAKMVAHCRAEGCHEACQRWLAAQTAARPQAPPEYCANAEILTRLRPQTGLTRQSQTKPGTGKTRC